MCHIWSRCKVMPLVTILCYPLEMNSIRQMIVEGLQPVIDNVHQTNPTDAEDARRCLPYIDCFCCLDTKRYIGDDLYDSYQVRSCSCSGLIQDLESIDDLNHTYRNRPLHYIGNNGTSAINTVYDVVRILAEIYRRDYQSLQRY